VAFAGPVPCPGAGGRGGVALAGCWAAPRVGDWEVTVLVWEPIVGPAAEVVEIPPWFGALCCPGTGGMGLGVTPTGCWDISGAGRGCRPLFLKVQNPIDATSYCIQGTMCKSVSCRFMCSCRVFHARRRGGGCFSSITLMDIRTNLVGEHRPDWGIRQESHERDSDQVPASPTDLAQRISGEGSPE